MKLVFHPDDPAIFISIADEDTSVYVWELNSTEPIMGDEGLRSIKGSAHDDYIKCVDFIDSKHLITGSYDRTLKVWGLGDTTQAKHTFKFDSPVEDFCFLDETKIMVANGSSISLVDLDKAEVVYQSALH